MAEGILLPRLLVLTDRRQAEGRGRSLVETVTAAIDGGARAILLREKDLPVPEREELARALLEVVAPFRGLLLVASDRSLARRVGAAGVHLAAADRWDPTGDSRLVVGRSCHDTEELHRAAQTGADYVTLSPVFATDSKPGYGPTLGTDGLSQLLRGPIRPIRELPPALALGGITPERVTACLEAGAYGVAVMGSVMRADDPSALVARFVESLAATRKGIR